MSVSAQELFSTDFSTEEDFLDWTVTDANEDGSTWKFDSSGEPSKVFYTYNGANAANDWLISPAITPVTDGMVAISFTVKGSSYQEKLQLMCGNAPTVEAMTTEMSEVLTLIDNITTHICLVEVKAGEPLHLGFKACSDADKWRLYLCNVSVQFIVDIAVTEIISPDSDFALSQEDVTIKVKNIGGVDVESFEVAFSVDGDTIATETVSQALAKGAEMEYTFSAKADLSTPRKQFNVTAWTIHADDINTTNDACSKSVLHKAPATVPYYMGFEKDEYTGGITLIDLNQDDGNWNIYSDPWWNLAHAGDYCLAYNYDKNNNGDDWAILEPITIEESGYYALKFWYSGDDSHPEKLGVYYGNEANPEALTNTIVEYAPFARSAYEQSINIIYLEKQDNFYIGFHAFSDKDENWLCVDDISFEKVDADKIDLAVTNLTNPGSYVHTGSLNDIKFEVCSYAVTDAVATVSVTIDETVIAQENVTITMLAQMTLELEDVLSSLAAGEHTLTIELVNADDTNTDNNKIKHTFRVMDAPVARWDFEDGKLPADFVFRAQDEGTVNESAGDEFNEEGWGILAIQSHPLYGNHVMAGTSWLTGTDQADRWCVLPPFAPTADSYLVWDVASYNPNFLETYSIMISSNGDDDRWYFIEEEYKNESADFKTRGISLADYAEKEEIYIAFRLRSKDCEHLILDNIELYGGAILEAGINGVADAAVNVAVSGDRIDVCGEEIVAVNLYAADGSLVAKSNGNLSTVGVAAGVYVVNVVTETSTYNKTVLVK
ncbi:MAG: choice-of-anchor J domain-containing protein [Bacteroidaceae bacterium]|nr:choice-of-anchor J domain-containing protein [Bacteroidaceae bacterium]